MDEFAPPSGPVRKDIRVTSDDLPPDPDEFGPDSDDWDDASDLDFVDMPCTDAGGSGCINDDDSRWDAFLADEDETDPAPDPRDFWLASETISEMRSRDG